MSYTLFWIIYFIRFDSYFAGLVVSIERFFGKAFVHIDNEMIDIKLGVFEKEYKIDWHEIKLLL